MYYSPLQFRTAFAFLTFVILAGLQWSCSPSTPKHACMAPSGKYVNSTVLSKCPGMMPADIPHFCFELNFITKDSVEVDNGFEHFALKYSASEDGCTCTIHGASLFGDMNLVVDSDSTFRLIDTAWTKVASPSSFSKVPADHEGGFETLLNECMLAGEYAIFENGNLRPHQVTILPNGQLNGFSPFLSYSLCYAGDCLEETDPPSRTIDLIDGQGQRQTFALKMIEGKMAIEFYSIGPPVPDIKGGRAIGPLVYDLRTE